MSWALGLQNLKGRYLASSRGHRCAFCPQVFDPVSASDTGEYSCEAQNGFGTPMMSDAVRMEAGERGGRQGWGSALGGGRSPFLLVWRVLLVPWVSILWSVSCSGAECGGHRGSCPSNAHSPWVADFRHLVRLPPRLL